MCKQKRRGMIYPWVEITSFMGASLESLGDKGDRVPTAIRWQQQTPLKHLLYALYMFSKLKSSSTWFNPCFPLRRAYTFLYCWVSLPTPFYPWSKHLCQLCVQQFLYVYLLHLLYCFVLTIIHEIYKLQVESNCWNLIFLCVASMPFT